MKNCQKLYILFFVCICINFHLHAQTPAPHGNPPVNFYIIKAQMDAYYDSIKQLIGEDSLNKDESVYSKYQANIRYWEPLVYPSGNFSTPFNALNKIGLINSTRATSSVSSDWTELGPFNQPSESVSMIGQVGGTGVVHFITIDPQNSNALVTGSPSGGLFYSTNGGNDWLNANTDELLPNLGISDCVIDPHNSNNWFIGTGDRTAIDDGNPIHCGWNASTGIYRKMGTGFNWQRIATESDLGASDGLGGIWTGWQIKKLIFDPSDATSNTLWAATSFGIYKTANALSTTPTWQHILGTGGINSDWAINDIEFIGSAIYATRDFLLNTATTANIIKSTDGGATWINFDNGINLTEVQRIEIETGHQANPTMLYALTTGTPTHPSHFYTINTSSQTTWTDKGAVPIGHYNEGVFFSHVTSLCVSPIKINPNEEILFGDYKPFYRSINGGTTWPYEISEDIVHGDIHDIVYAPDGNTIYIATDGGVWKSTNDGTTWVAKNSGLGVETIYRMVGSASNSDIVLQGNQDCGTNLKNGTNWTHVYGGDGLTPMIDFKDPNNMYASYIYGSIVRSDDMGANFLLGASSGGGSSWSTFEIMNTSDPKIFYQANGEIMRTSDRGNSGTWTNISHGFVFYNGSWSYLKQSIPSIFTAPSDPNYLYAIVENNNTYMLVKTSNANADVDGNNPNNVAWSVIPQHPAFPFNKEIVDIAVDDKDPEILWIVYAGFNDPPNFIDKKIWKYDGHTQTWTNLTTGLADISIKSMVKEKGSDDALYIGTNATGVFYTNNKFIISSPSNPWQQFLTGLPNVNISQLEINYASNTIRAATFGRGLWVSPLACPPAGPLNLTGVETQNNFQEADELITSTQAFNSGLTNTYRATDEIVLLPGFVATATPGSNFKAYIHPCNLPGNSFRKLETNNNNSTIQQSTLIGKAQSLANNNIGIIPNPNNGTFQISVTKNNQAVGVKEVKVYDIMGKVIWENITPIGNLFKVDISGYSRGIYYVRAINEMGEVEVKKLIKQ